MAKTIFQRIALEGGKGIADELRKIGKDGEAAFVDIRSAAAKLSKDLGAVGKSFSDLGGSLSTVGKRLGIAGGAAIAAAAGVVAFAKGGADAADSASKQSQALGLAVDEYGRLSFAASQSGVDAGTFGTAITRLNQEVAKASDGNAAAVAKFKELGVSVKDAGGNVKSTETLMAELSDAFAKLPAGAEKSALAVSLFGRSGAQLLPLLNGGADAIRGLGQEAERLGIVFTPENALNAEAMNDALAAVRSGLDGTRFQLGLLFAPTITKAARGFQKVIEDNRQALQTFVEQGLEKALPIVNDFISAILGNDADVKNVFVLKVKLEFLRFAFAVQNAVNQIIVPAYELIISTADRVANAINSIFGTAFTGQQILVAAVIGKLLGLFTVLGATVKVLATSFVALKSAFGFIALVTQSGAAFTILAGAIKGVGAALLGILGLPGLLVAALAGVAVIIYRNWDAISEGGRIAWDFIKRTFEGAPAFFLGVFSNVGTSIANGFTAAGELIGAVWDSIKQGGQIAIDGIKAAFNGAGEFLSGVFVVAANAVAEALQGIASAASGIWQDVRTTATTAIAGLADAARDLWAGIARSAQEQLAGLVAVFENLNANLARVWEAIMRGAAVVFTFMRDGFTGVVSFIGNLFDGLANRIERVWNRIKSIIASAKAALSSVNENNTGTSSQREGFASGGYVSGPGSGTSDSILARLSDGEFVVKAAAVRKYGPGLLAAINSMRFKMPKFATGGQVNVSNAIKMPAFKAGGMVKMPALPQFNIGGLVDSLTHGMQYTIPRFADGGMVAIPAQSQGRPVTLNIDGRTFDGLTASEKTAEDLTRFATNRRLKSAGRKPGWVGG